MGRDQQRPWVNGLNSHSFQGPSVKAAPYPVVCNPTASSPMEVQNDAQHNAGARGLLQIKGNPIGSINGEPENCGMQWLTLVLEDYITSPGIRWSKRSHNSQRRVVTPSTITCWLTSTTRRGRSTTTKSRSRLRDRYQRGGSPVLPADVDLHQEDSIIFRVSLI